MAIYNNENITKSQYSKYLSGISNKLLPLALEGLLGRVALVEGIVEVVQVDLTLPEVLDGHFHIVGGRPGDQVSVIHKLRVTN